jgi:hypothetical protein
MEEFLMNIRANIIEGYGERLVSIALFGSVSRRRYTKGSDIDILIVAEDLDDSLGKRIDTFFSKIGDYRELSQYSELKDLNLPNKLQPIVLEPEEIRRRPPLLLDLTSDSRILFDKGDFLKEELERLSADLKRLGAKKVMLSEDRWYWILKPGIKKGEIVSL